MVEEKDTNNTNAAEDTSSVSTPQPPTDLAREVGLPVRTTTPPPKAQRQAQELPTLPPVQDTGVFTPPIVANPATPAAAATHTPEPQQKGSVLEDDIAKILNTSKLPERKEFRASGDMPKPQAPTPTKTPEKQGAAPAVITPSSPTNKNNLASVHTLKDDLQNVVRDENISLVRAAALEEDKRAHHEHESDFEDVRGSQRRRFAGMIITIFVLIALGGIALAAVFFVIQARQESSGNAFLAQGFLFSEQTIPFTITGESALRLKQGLAGARSSSALTLGAITRLAPIVQETNAEGAPVEREATLAEFLDAIEAHAPADLVRALGSDFFFGIHTVDENAPLFVIPVVSYERAFAGMLTWEKTINRDLAPAFTAVSPLVKNEEGLVVERSFEATVMRNYDVRVLKDDSGAAQLYYSFPTRNLLIIAESPYSFSEILSRLRAERKL